MGYSKEPALRSLIRIALYCSACLPHQTFPEVTGSRETSQLSSPSYILKSVFGLRASKFLCSVPELFDTCNYRETGLLSAGPSLKESQNSKLHLF